MCVYATRRRDHIVFIYDLQDKGFVTAALESWLGSKEEKSAVLSDAGGPFIPLCYLLSGMYRTCDDPRHVGHDWD